MSNLDSTLSKRYAEAFLTVSGDSFTQNDCENVATVRGLLEENRSLLFFLNVSLIEQSIIDHAINTLFGTCATLQVLKKLVLLLIQHKRAILLPGVLLYIERLFRKKIGMFCCGKSCMSFAIKSSHELRDRDIKALIAFLEQETGKKIVYTRSIDKDLIAGIRLQSDTLLWEYSVKRQLERLQQSLIDSGE